MSRLWVKMCIRDRVWTYAGIDEMIATFKASLVIEALYVIYRLLWSIDMPRSFYVFNWVFLFILLAGARLSIRIFKQFRKKYRKTGEKRNVMIVGAGSAASLLIKELEFGPGSSRIVCIICLLYTSIGSRMYGVKGALAATLGVVAPSFIIIIVVVSFLGAKMCIRDR